MEGKIYLTDAFALGMGGLSKYSLEVEEISNLDELIETPGISFIHAVKKPAIVDGLQKVFGLWTEPKFLDIETLPGDIIYVVQAKGGSYEPTGKFPDGFRLKVYRVLVKE